MARIAHLAPPEDPEVTGLLALMLLTEARHPARTNDQGGLISLAEQDRSLWNGELIAEGLALIADAWSKGAIGDYQFQAAVAAAHDRRRRDRRIRGCGCPNDQHPGEELPDDAGGLAWASAGHALSRYSADRRRSR